MHHVTAERDYDANLYCRRRLWQLWLPPLLATVILSFLFLFFQLINIIGIVQQNDVPMTTVGIGQSVRGGGQVSEARRAGKQMEQAKQDLIGNRSQVSTYGRHLSNLICI